MRPEDIVLWIGVVLTVLNIIDRASILREKARTPYKELEQRISHIEDVVEKIIRDRNNDVQRIRSLEEGNRVQIKAIGALLSHGIDGNNIQEMKIAREEANDYLIGRRCS